MAEDDHGVEQLKTGRHDNEHVDNFGFYNGRRPHSSLDRQTPDRAYFGQLPKAIAA